MYTEIGDAFYKASYEKVVNKKNVKQKKVVVFCSIKNTDLVGILILEF